MNPGSEDAAPTERRPRVLLSAAAGAVLMWLAQPPAGAWPLAYAGLACWLTLASQSTAFGRTDYVKLWAGGWLYWLLTVHWVRLPCWPLTGLGWPILAAYLACYSVATVWLIRIATRRRVPLWLAAPVAWTGMELLQARLFTGFLMGAVSHSHAGQAWVRSIASVVGAYGVTFAIVVIAAVLTSALRGWRVPAPWPLARLAAVVGLVVAGNAAATVWVEIESPSGDRPTVALIQSNSLALWGGDHLKRSREIMDRLPAMTAEAAETAVSEGKSLDLVVWPESMYRSPIIGYDGTPRFSASDDPSGQYAKVIATTADGLRRLSQIAGGAALVVGIDRFDLPLRSGDDSLPPDLYNSVAATDRSGEVTAIYDKTHLVPFGEYIPLADGLPGLYYLTPMSGGLRQGDGPVVMDIPLAEGGVLRLCPSICYESVVPRVIRRQAAELTRRGERPDALVNVTNDAWFWGSSELDMHLACGVFRAIENGLPLLVAANGGLSAVIDARGEVLAVSGRMTEQSLVADVPPRSVSPTPYLLYGDWFAGGCLALCAAMAGSWGRTWGRHRRQRSEAA